VDVVVVDVHVSVEHVEPEAAAVVVVDVVAANDHAVGPCELGPARIPTGIEPSRIVECDLAVLEHDSHRIGAIGSWLRRDDAVAAVVVCIHVRHARSIALDRQSYIEVLFELGSIDDPSSRTTSGQTSSEPSRYRNAERPRR
jgi:hypothetical protein